MLIALNYAMSFYIWFFYGFCLALLIGLFWPSSKQSSLSLFVYVGLANKGIHFSLFMLNKAKKQSCFHLYTVQSR